MATLVLDPITRLEGHLKINVTLDSSNNVTVAQASGGLYISWLLKVQDMKF